MKLILKAMFFFLHLDNDLFEIQNHKLLFGTFNYPNKLMGLNLLIYSNYMSAYYSLK